MTSFVIDNSVMMCWCFEDQKTPYTEAILDALSKEASAVAPALWVFEALNVLVVAQRKKKMTQAQAIRFWDELQALPIRTHEKYAPHAHMEILALAGQHHLTAYDAAYLELAIREGLPLATLDGSLQNAAKSAGVMLFEP